MINKSELVRTKNVYIEIILNISPVSDPLSKISGGQLTSPPINSAHYWLVESYINIKVEYFSLYIFLKHYKEKIFLI